MKIYKAKSEKCEQEKMFKIISGKLRQPNVYYFNPRGSFESIVNKVLKFNAALKEPRNELAGIFIVTFIIKYKH